MQAHYQKIYQTSDFSKFSFIRENRDIRTCHVNHLKESISKDNRLYLHPIIVFEKDDKLYVEDGQHRLEACKELNTAIYYVVNENFKNDSIVDDQISLKWDLKDRLKHFKERGFEQYLKFQYLMDKYEMPFQPMFYLLGSQKFENAKLFRDGKLIINEKMEKFIKETYNFRVDILKI